MTASRSLYEEVILDHNRKPRNFGKMADANRHMEGFNPLCGDHFTIYLKMNGDVIESVSFDGSGCAISKSSASVMTTVLKGKTRPEAEKLFQKFHRMITSEVGSAVDEEALGKLQVFSGVREYPVRIKCATLAWHAVMAALEEKEPEAPVSTE